MMLIEAAFFWKTMLSVIHSKILHHSFIPTTYENLETWFEQLKKQKEFWDNFTG